MSRRELREQIFQMLFRLDFYTKDQMDEQQTLFLQGLWEDMINDSSRLDEAAIFYIQSKVRGFREHLEEIDAKINEITTGWKISRMSKVDLTIIRLAVYEIVYDEDIPNRVAVNEAVNLARIYGADDSPSFVNGVLAKLL